MSRQAFSRLLVAAMAAAFALNVSAILSAQEPPPPAMPESNAADAEAQPSESSSALAPRAMAQILPYDDYDPLLPSDTAHLGYLCPHPDGSVCQPMAEGEEEPIRCPPEIDLAGNPYEEKMFAESMFLWEASNVFHNPLYFEDAPLERYGHTHHKLLQPFASVGLFGTQLLGLPYQMTIDPVRKKMYALGWYRPGECTPYKHYQVPLNAKAAAVQGGVVTGLFFLIP